MRVLACLIPADEHFEIIRECGLVGGCSSLGEGSEVSKAQAKASASLTA